MVITVQNKLPMLFRSTAPWLHSGMGVDSEDMHDLPPRHLVDVEQTARADTLLRPNNQYQALVSWFITVSTPPPSISTTPTPLKRKYGSFAYDAAPSDQRFNVPTFVPRLKPLTVLSTSESSCTILSSLSSAVRNHGEFHTPLSAQPPAPARTMSTVSQ